MTRKQRITDADIARAKAWSLEYLAKLAGRPSEAGVLCAERKPFGSYITFAPIRTNDAYLFCLVGYQRGNTGYQDFLNLSVMKQTQIIDLLMILACGNEIRHPEGNKAATNPVTFWDATDELFKNMACNGKLTSPEICQRAAQFWATPRPTNKRGLSRPETDQRKAILLSLMRVLTCKHYGLPVTNNVTNSHGQNACGVIAKVCKQEFPQDKAAFSETAIRKVWYDRPCGQTASS